MPGYPEIHPGGHKAKEAANPTFVNLDDPEHKEQRAMLEADFSPETVQKKWRPMMERTVDELLDQFVEKGKSEQPIDLIQNFAAEVPTQIMFKVLGVPESEIPRLSKDSEVRNSTSRNAAESANNELQDYMAQLVRAKIQQPGDDVISHLVVNQLKPGDLSEDDVTTLSFLVLTAGNAALINSIGLGTLTLLEYPDQLRDFKENPKALAGSLVNEISRYHTTSALNSRRTVKQDLEFSGHQFSKGDGVICSVQSANRDEDKFKDPEKFDIRREFDYGDSLGWGYGPHRCQGEAFSRAELEITFTKLFKRLPDMRLAKAASELPYSPATMNVGVAELPVYFE